MRIAIVSTGGTIASEEEAGGDATPSMSAAELASTVPDLGRDLEVDPIDFSRIASQNFTLDRFHELTDRLRTLDEDAETSGIVVTHGTNALEESAYFVDLCYGGSTPVVFTGAMRNVSDPGPDGPANLRASVLAALQWCETAGNTLVVMNDQVFTPRGVRKRHSMRVDSFGDPEFGPLATVDGDRVNWRRTPIDPDPVLDPDSAALPDEVRIVYCAVDMVDGPVRDATSADGVVLATMGPGHVPASITGALRDLAERDLPVVATTRSQAGRLYRRKYGFEGSEKLLSECGFRATDLSPPQARVKLAVAVAAGRFGDAFEQPDWAA